MKTKLRAFLLGAVLFVGLPLASSSAFVAVSVGFAPPPIPVYEQPACPVEGYLWTPGYWGYGDFGYYWVPGVWVAPPQVGFLWTPGYWGFRGGHYLFIDGYWGPTVGFYGGINYGFGYGGFGYVGGEWAGGVFRYNRAVTRVNTTIIHNTYINKQVVKNNAGTRASFNGPGGSTAKPTAQQQAAAKASHVPATSEQKSVAQAAQKDPSLQAKNNKGKPKTAALTTASEKPGGAASTSNATGEKKTPVSKTSGQNKVANGSKVSNQPKTANEQTGPKAKSKTKAVQHNPEMVNKGRNQPQTHVAPQHLKQGGPSGPGRGGPKQPNGKNKKDQEKPQG